MENELTQTTSNLPANVGRLWDESLNEDMSMGGFDIPTVEIIHGQAMYKLPNGQIVDTFKGVYLGERRFNVYWEKLPAGTADVKRPPTCVAQDAKHPETKEDSAFLDGEERTIYGECSKCYYNEFGSKGNGKMCANKSLILIWPLGVNAVMPWTLIASPSSLCAAPKPSRFDSISRAGKTIRMMIAAGNTPLFAIYSEFALDKHQGPSMEWSTIKAKVLGSLDPTKPDDNPDFTMNDALRCRSFAKHYWKQLNDENIEDIGSEAPNVDADISDTY